MIFYYLQLTVIHPRARTNTVGGVLPGSVAVEEQATKIPVAHAQVVQHHVDVHPHAVVERYERQPLVSATSQFILY